MIDCAAALVPMVCAAKVSEVGVNVTAERMLVRLVRDECITAALERTRSSVGLLDQCPLVLSELFRAWRT